MSDNNESIGQEAKKKLEYRRDLLWLLLLILVSGITLLVRIHEVELDASTSDVYQGMSRYYDYFSYWKSTFLTGILIALSLYWLFVVLMRKETISFPRAYYLLLIHGLMVFLSAILSPFQWISFMGFPDRLEGLYALMAYLAIALTFSWVLSTDKRRSFLFACLFIVCAALSILGMTQYIGKDFFQTELGKNILVPSSYSDIREKMTYNFGANIMYVTVYNPNNLGSYSAMLLPLTFGLLLRMSQKRDWRVILGHAMVVASFILWIGGMSRAGLLGGGIAMLLMAVFTFRSIRTHWRQVLITALICLTVMFGMNHLSNGAVLKEFLRTMPDRIAVLFPGGKELVEQIEIKKVLSTQLTEDQFTFVTETETLQIQYLKDKFLFHDEDGNELLLSKTNDGVFIDDPRYSDYALQLHSDAVVMQWKKHNIPLAIMDGRMTVQMSETLFAVKMHEPEQYGFKGKERFGSGRGYIWSRSFPLLKDTLLLGHGPDTYAAYFPQYELSAKINWLYQYNIMVDKPHSWYLQMGINTGVLSLVCMVVFLLWYLYASVRRSRKMQEGGSKIMQNAVMCAIVGYCIAAFFNDSTVSVAPVFWSLLGTGLSYIVHEKTYAGIAFAMVSGADTQL